MLGLRPADHARGSVHARRAVRSHQQRLARVRSPRRRRGDLLGLQRRPSALSYARAMARTVTVITLVALSACSAARPPTAPSREGPLARASIEVLGRAI